MDEAAVFSRSVIALLVAVLASACSSGSGAASGPYNGPSTTTPAVLATAKTPATRVLATARPYTLVDLGNCLDIATGKMPADERRCPGFIEMSATEAAATCKAVGGTLVAAQQPSLQSLDVNGDGQSEFLYDFTENFVCDNSPSVFSCGSLGCPVVLTQKRDGIWNTIGTLRSYDAFRAELLAAEGDSAYGIVRAGCGGKRPCEEMWHYRWDGSAYQITTIEVRGHVVDFANDGLWALIDDQSVLAEPSPDAAVLDRYPKDTIVVVIGDARATPYKYVSPCNACTSGFVDAGVLRNPRE